MGAGVLWVKTRNGTIELVNLPKDAEVLVDGEKIVVIWPGAGKPGMVTVTPGKHKITFRKNGIETSSDELTVQPGRKEEFTMRYVPLGAERPQSEKAVAVQPSPAKKLAFFPADVLWGNWRISSNEVLVRQSASQSSARSYTKR